jgi:hypothetical protein
MPDTAEAIFVVGLNVNEEVEERWNEWYEAVHVPEVVAASDDIVSATRYKLTDGSTPFSYLAIYRFASEEGLARFMASPTLAGMSAQYTKDWGAVSDRVRGAFVPVSHLVPNR